MATYGDPLMALGSSLAYCIHADDSDKYQAMRNMSAHLSGMMIRQGLVDRYGVK